MSVRSLGAEAIAVSVSRRSITSVTVLIVTVGAFIPLMISGQAQAARTDALQALDRAEQRIITITNDDFESNGSLSPATVSQLKQLSVVQDLVALGAIRDTRSANGWPASQRIPTVDVLAVGPADGDPCGSVRLPQPLVTETYTLHLATRHAFIAVVGHRKAEPLLSPEAGVATRYVCDWTSARQVLVLVDEPTSVTPFVELVPTVGGTNLEIAVPDNLEDLRQEVATGLSNSAQQLRNLAMIGAGLLVGATMFVANTTQTKHLARRRALGATRSDIAILILTQVALNVSIGLVAGIGTYLVATANQQNAFDVNLATAVAITLLLTSLVASLPVALVAATRDPARVLRVP